MDLGLDKNFTPSNDNHARKRDKWVSLFGRRKNTTMGRKRSGEAETILPDSNSLADVSPQTLGPTPPGQTRYLPSEEEANDDEGAAIGELSLSTGSWERAYQALKLREPDLVTAYERILASYVENSTNASFSLDKIVNLTNSKLQDREATQLVIRLGKQPIRVREQGEKIIRFIFWSKEIISAATSTQPFAALAWFGISMVLKLSLNSSQQTHAMIEGLNSISDLLRFYRIVENDCSQAADLSGYSEFGQAIEDLYSSIFEYQTRMICHLSQSVLKRGLRGTLKLDDWEGMLQKVRAHDEICTRLSRYYNREKAWTLFTDEATTMHQSLTIQKRILDMMEVAQARIEQDRQHDREAELLETLASNYESDKNFISERVLGTCEWFFEDERFLRWRDSKDSKLLWVSAGPGCGKSVLSRTLIDERKICANAMTSTVCYFFFSDGEEQRNHGTDALSAILHQLLENTGRFMHALPSYKKYGRKLRDNFSELWRILAQSARDSEVGEIICVLDALDECEQSARNQLVDQLISFYLQVETIKSPTFSLKFLVTSRPYEDLEDKFQQLSGIGTYVRFDCDDRSYMIGQDINLVIDEKLSYFAANFDREDGKRISKRLKDMDNRTYLWLYLTIDIISRARSKFSKVSSIETLLSDLPTKISDAYERILSRSSDKFTARLLLQLIVAAKRPLTLEEANIALTLATQKEPCTSCEAMDLWPQRSFKSIIMNMCGLFVSVHDGRISLLHQTAREFLIQGPQSTASSLYQWQGSLNLTAANNTMADVCLKFLALDDFSSADLSRFSGDGNLKKKYNGHEFRGYASLYWPMHYSKMKAPSDMQRIAHKICDTSLSYYNYWFWHYLHQLGCYLDYSSWTGLNIASLLGLTDIAHQFLNEEADVDFQGEAYSHALQMAASAGCKELVQRFLDLGANADAQGGWFGNALQAASFRGHLDIVQLLLDQRGDVNVQGGIFGTALQAAAVMGDDNTVQLLLARGADVNICGVDFRESALYTASSRGHAKVVQTLLEKGANVNASSGEFGTALQVATSFYDGNDTILRLLLSHGAILNKRDSQGRTELHLAAIGGRLDALRMLLNSGSDPTLVDIQGRNCLLHAASGGSSQIVWWLLQEGFDRDYTDLDGWSALHWAAKNGSIGTMEVLHAAGSTPTREKLEGWLPESVAIFHYNEHLLMPDFVGAHSIARSPLLLDHDSAAPLSVAEPDDALKVSPGTLYDGYDCDGCDLAIYGVRYRCMNCEDFDYCFKCKASSDRAHPDHQFEALVALPTDFDNADEMSIDGK